MEEQREQLQEVNEETKGSRTDRGRRKHTHWGSKKISNHKASAKANKKRKAAKKDRRRARKG